MSPTTLRFDDERDCGDNCRSPSLREPVRDLSRPPTTLDPCREQDEIASHSASAGRWHMACLGVSLTRLRSSKERPRRRKDVVNKSNIIDYEPEIFSPIQVKCRRHFDSTK